MGELLDIAIISMLGMWGGLLIMFGLWIVKQHIRHKYLIKRAAMAKRNPTVKSAVKEPTALGGLENIASLAKSLENMNPDTLENLGELYDRFTGGEGGGELEGILNSPIVRGVLEGVKQGQAKQPETGEGTQVY